jgi:hypothetical protein
MYINALSVSVNILYMVHRSSTSIELAYCQRVSEHFFQPLQLASLYALLTHIFTSLQRAEGQLPLIHRCCMRLFFKKLLIA